MPKVYSFSRTDAEILQELLRVFSSGRGTAREQWCMQAEMLVEPVGWDSLWKLSKEFCKRFEVRFPCVAYITVTSVDFENLMANVDVLGVQHEAVRLPESVEEVPLVDLWPTEKQRESCINAATTAEFIDLMRFFYTNIWMPWDDQDDKILLSNTIEERMQLWIDLHNGTIPSHVSRSIFLLRADAIKAHEKLKELDSSLIAEDLVDEDEVTHLGPLSAATGLPPVLFNMDNWQKVDTVTGVSGHTANYKGREDSMLPANYISTCAEVHARLDSLISKWTIYENPLIREQYLANAKIKWQKERSKRNVVALWKGGNIFEFDELSQFLRTRISGEQTLSIVASAEEGLSIEPEEAIICSKTYEVPEIPLSQISICSYNGSTLKSTDMRSCLLMLSEDCKLRDLTLHCRLVNTVLVVRSGVLRINNCMLTDDSKCYQSDFAQGIVAMTGAKILIEDCVFDNFYSGIVVHKGAQVEIRNSLIKKCGVGIQMFSGALVSMLNSNITDCSEQCIRYEMGRTGSKRASIEGLNIAPNCKIGSGDKQKEILVVQQDVDI